MVRILEPCALAVRSSPYRHPPYTKNESSCIAVLGLQQALDRIVNVLSSDYTWLAIIVDTQLLPGCQRISVTLGGTSCFVGIGVGVSVTVSVTVTVTVMHSVSVSVMVSHQSSEPGTVYL